MAIVLPFMLLKPKIMLGGTLGAGTPPAVPTGGVDITCFSHKVEFKPDEPSTDLEGFCFVARAYKPTRLTVTISMFQSFGVDNLWDTIVPIEKTNQPLAITPDGVATGATAANPTWYAIVHVPPVPFLNADVGEASDFDLDFDVQGAWYYSPVPNPAVGTLAVEPETADA